VCSYIPSSDLRSRRIVSGCGREFLPTAKRCKSVEVEDGDAMHDGMTYFHYTLEADQSLIIDFIFSQPLGVIAEIAQKPAHLPHGSGCAGKPAGNQAAGQMLGFENSETNLVIRFLRMPAILHPIHPDEKQTIRNGVNGRPIC